MDHGDRAWVMAAGLPIYIALFGRDTLTAGWQAALASPQMMRGALCELPKWQGRVENDWRDEQPGRMLHEAHTGPLASLFYNPRTRYYGAATTSSFYPVVLSELWHWTGDKSLIQPLLEPALRGLGWKDKYTDLFGDGFYDYKSRSQQGNGIRGGKIPAMPSFMKMGGRYIRQFQPAKNRPSFTWQNFGCRRCFGSWEIAIWRAECSTKPKN